MHTQCERIIIMYNELLLLHWSKRSEPCRIESRSIYARSHIPFRKGFVSSFAFVSGRGKKIFGFIAISKVKVKLLHLFNT